MAQRTASRTLPRPGPPPCPPTAGGVRMGAMSAAEARKVSESTTNGHREVQEREGIQEREAAGSRDEDEGQHDGGPREVAGHQQPLPVQRVGQHAAERADHDRGEDLDQQQAAHREARAPALGRDQHEQRDQREPVPDEAHCLGEPEAGDRGARAEDPEQPGGQSVTAPALCLRMRAASESPQAPGTGPRRHSPSIKRETLSFGGWSRSSAGSRAGRTLS